MQYAQKFIRRRDCVLLLRLCSENGEGKEIENKQTWTESVTGEAD